MSPDDVIALVTRKPRPAAPLHLNVRLTKDDATIYEELRKMSPKMTDSQRVKDSLRLSTYLLVTKDPVVKQVGVFQ